MALGIISIFFGGTLGLIAWATAAVSGWAAYSIRESRGRWMAWMGLGLGVLFGFVNAYLNGHLDGLAGVAPTSAEDASVVPGPELPGLGVTVEEFSLNWERALGTWQELCDAVELDQTATWDCPPGQLPRLDLREPAVHPETGTAFWDQDLIRPATFFGMTKDGVFRTVTVWSFEPIDTDAQGILTSLLCEATYLGIDPSLTEDGAFEKCGVVLERLFRAAIRSGPIPRFAELDSDRVYWRYSVLQPHIFSLQGSSDPPAMSGG